jgi:Arc-like DNA binding domain
MARRKRIGRPPKPAKERKSVNFTFRSRGDMRQKLRDAAALGGRSISEEIERRLDLSFQQEQMAMEAVKAALKLLLEEREVAKEVTSKKIEED